jgi:uncharacterized protein YciI
MLVFIYCADRPGAAAVRARVRQQHLEYMLANSDKLVFGGLLAALPGGRSGGSVYVLELPTVEAADDFVAHEPYYRAGVFDTVVTRPFRQMWPEPEPGALESALQVERERLASEDAGSEE